MIKKHEGRRPWLNSKKSGLHSSVTGDAFGKEVDSCDNPARLSLSTRSLRSLKPFGFVNVRTLSETVEKIYLEETNMAHFMNERVSIKKLTEELRDHTKKPILKNKLQEIDEFKNELFDLNEKELEYYRVYLESVFDKYNNSNYIFGFIAFAGVMFTIMSQFYLILKDSLSNSIFMILLLVLTAIVSYFSINAIRTKASLALAIKIIDIVQSNKKVM